MINQPEIDLTKQLPVQNINRLMFIHMLRNIGADLIKHDLYEKHHMFILEVEDDKGIHYEIDYEFCLFYATLHQMNRLKEDFKTLVEKANENREHTSTGGVLSQNKA